MNKKAFNLLLRSFDAELNQSDRCYLQNELAHGGELKTEQKRMLALRDNLALGRIDYLGPQFSDLVLQSIRLRDTGAQSALVSTLLAAFRPVALASAVVIALLTSFNAYYTTLTNHRDEGIDEVLAMIQDAHSLSLEAQLCVQK